MPRYLPLSPGHDSLAYPHGPNILMCLIALAWQYHPTHALVVAANRDEFYRRPATAAARWPDDSRIVAGRDEEQGGTWLGIAEHGRFAAITNARGVGGAKDAPSRGFLVRDFLQGTDPVEDCAANIMAEIHRYAGCNLLLADAGQLWYITNHPQPERRQLAPGLHALSNGHIDHLWPKMQKVRDGLGERLAGNEIDHSSLFDMMTDRSPANKQDLPNTGVGKVLERQLSPVFIRLPVYGTRCTTVLSVDNNGQAKFSERRFNAGGRVDGETTIDLQLAWSTG